MVLCFHLQASLAAPVAQWDAVHRGTCLVFIGVTGICGVACIGLLFLPRFGCAVLSSSCAVAVVPVSGVVMTC